MRKKPDILLLLSVLVVSGVIISNFVVTRHNDRTTGNLFLPDAQYSRSQTDHIMNSNSEFQKYEFKMLDFKSQELVRIDLSKQQIH